MEICRKNKWQFMIVLKDKALPSVMREFDAISRLEPKNRSTDKWGKRKQQFRWVNDVDISLDPTRSKCKSCMLWNVRKRGRM
jgi:hypothetical protein